MKLFIMAFFVVVGFVTLIFVLPFLYKWHKKEKAETEMWKKKIENLEKRKIFWIFKLLKPMLLCNMGFVCNLSEFW